MCWKGCSCDLLNTAQGNTEVLGFLAGCEGAGVDGGHKRKQGFFFFFFSEKSVFYASTEIHSAFHGTHFLILCATIRLFMDYLMPFTLGE